MLCRYPKLLWMSDFTIYMILLYHDLFMISGVRAVIGDCGFQRHVHTDKYGKVNSCCYGVFSSGLSFLSKYFDT